MCMTNLMYMALQCTYYVLVLLVNIMRMPRSMNMAGHCMAIIQIWDIKHEVFACWFIPELMTWALCVRPLSYKYFIIYNVIICSLSNPRSESR